MKQIVEMYYNDFCQQPDCALSDELYAWKGCGSGSGSWDSAHLDTVSDELSQELVKNGDANAYYVSYFKNVAYESEYYESIKRRLILEEINDHVVQLEPTECTFESAKVQVGFASVQIDEMTYGIIVFQIPTVRPAEAETTGVFS